MTKPVKNIRKLRTRRVVLIYILSLAFSIGIIAQTFNLMVFQRKKWEDIKENPIKLKETPAKRGNILSIHGNLLATSVPWYKVIIDTENTPGWKKIFESNDDSTILNLDTMSWGIAKFKQEPPEKVLSDLYKCYKNGDQYIFRKHFIFREYDELKKLPILDNGRFKTGLYCIMHSERVKPYGELAKRTIGALKKDGGGHNGFEKAFNEYLAGKPGKCLMQKIGGGNWMPVDKNASAKAEDGFDVQTTINIDFQDITHNALLKKLIETNAHHGSVVLMEVETGEVLAIANLSEDINGYEEDYNYAVGERTEPGSTMKLASLMAAIEDGYIELDDTIDTGNGIFHYNGMTIKDTKKGGYGIISVKEVFKVSSNIGVVKLIIKYYENKPEEFIDRLYTFNINKSMKIEIPGGPPPIIKYTDDSLWWAGSLGMIAYGYEIKFTAMQILTFYNAIANNGKMVRPRFLKALLKNGKVKKRFSTDVIDNSICSRSTLKKAKIMLESVVDNGYRTDETGKKVYSGLRGTAYNIKSDSYKIAGKTGTSQIADEDRGYGEKDGKRDYQASFVGYFPADNPRYSCIVVINSPKGANYYGNTVAGEVFKEVADKVYARSFAANEENMDDNKNSLPISLEGSAAEAMYLFDEFDIPVNDDNITSDWVSTKNLNDSIIILKDRLIADNNYMPKVKGMGLKDALFILENKRLKVIIEGNYGRVINQYPKPNRKILRGEQVKIVLKK
ncbi:MAG: penicillin-binding protein [Bacteroidota bacterium]|nr:penicillin-binding protein [Bacteroidota bacterium]